MVIHLFGRMFQKVEVRGVGNLRFVAIQEVWPVLTTFFQRLLQEPAGMALLVFVPVVMVVALTLWLQRWYRRWLGWWLRRRGLRAENAALKYLKKEGFEIVDAAPRLVYNLLIDGRPRTFTITPDLVVSRDGCDYVVEVKRKDSAGSINNAGVRRQVLEYVVAGGLPCLLVDMKTREITTVCLDAGFE